MAGERLALSLDPGSRPPDVDLGARAEGDAPGGRGRGRRDPQLVSARARRLRARARRRGRAPRRPRPRLGHGRGLRPFVGRRGLRGGDGTAAGRHRAVRLVPGLPAPARRRSGSGIWPRRPRPPPRRAASTRCPRSWSGRSAPWGRRPGAVSRRIARPGPTCRSSTRWRPRRPPARPPPRSSGPSSPWRPTEPCSGRPGV